MNIIGPIDQLTWTTMIDLKRSINFYKKYPGQYEEALYEETSMLGELISGVSKAA